jgi:NAD(P)H dehydrogenase (quinone)
MATSAQELRRERMTQRAKVGIVWHSGTGYTSLLAEAIAQGAAESAEVVRLQIDPADIIEGRYGNEEAITALDDCDGIIFGSPTYMGSVSAQTKAFLDACLSRWYERAWRGKLGAAFTVSSTPSGDKLNALYDLLIFGMQMGMVWAGQDESPISGDNANRLGVYVGVAAQPDYQAEAPTLMTGDATGGERLGRRVAELAGRLQD